MIIAEAVKKALDGAKKSTESVKVANKPTESLKVVNKDGKVMQIASPKVIKILSQVPIQTATAPTETFNNILETAAQSAGIANQNTLDDSFSHIQTDHLINMDESGQRYDSEYLDDVLNN